MKQKRTPQQLEAREGSAQSVQRSLDLLEVFLTHGPGYIAKLARVITAIADRFSRQLVSCEQPPLAEP